MDTSIVTKLLNGVPDENGVAYLTESHIPYVTPNAGYGNGSWVSGAPTADTQIFTDTTYTYSFAKLPVVPGI